MCSSNDAIIFAPVTPPGQSGVAVFRVSGRDLSGVLSGLSLPAALPAREAVLCILKDPTNGSPIDQALALYFPAPHSFTGEDVLELHTHGGGAVRRALLDALSALPRCRLAEAGEFSKRAFLNGKMDLLQAEGIADLIAAETAMQQQLALRQLDGEMSERFADMRTMALRSLALLEAYLDFPDEEIPEETLNEVNRDLGQLKHTIHGLLKEPPCGELIREGFTIALIGPPNAGKSSLMNRLAKRDVAIVSDVAGTTRDRIEVHLNIGGYLVRLIDTAGMRDTQDAIEAEGVRRAKQAASDADLTLVIYDIVSDTKQIALHHGLAAEQTLIIWNKADQSPAPAPPSTGPIASLFLSALTGDGIDALLEQIGHRIDSRLTANASPLLTRTRHRHALGEALASLEATSAELPLELMAEDVRAAARSIGKITGHIDVDQLLDVIFREFCIGK
jgi:tRNA modification GTPase